MKLTEDDVYAIDQALRYCYVQDAYIYTGTDEEETVAFDKLREKFDGKQTIKNQEIVDNLEKWRTQLIDQLSMLPNEHTDYPTFDVSEKIRLILEGKDIKELS